MPGTSSLRLVIVPSELSISKPPFGSRMNESASTAGSRPKCGPSRRGQGWEVSRGQNRSTAPPGTSWEYVNTEPKLVVNIAHRNSAASVHFESLCKLWLSRLSEMSTLADAHLYSEVPHNWCNHFSGWWRTTALHHTENGATTTSVEARKYIPAEESVRRRERFCVLARTKPQ